MSVALADLSRRLEIRRLARTNPVVAAALSLVDGNGLAWDEAMECLVLGLAEDRERLLSDLVALRSAHAPTVFALPVTDDDGSCLGCAEQPCVGGHP